MKFTEFKKQSINEDKDLFEIKMSPSNLRREAAKTGALAGMEFEMIVPGVADVDREPDYEPDYDQDQRARSFSDVEDFFFDGDYNGRRDVQRLLNDLGEAYMEWKMDRTADDWESEGVDFLRDYIENNDLFDRDEALSQARDALMDAEPDMDTDSEEFQQLLSTAVNELEEKFVQNEFEAQGRIYNDAFEEFADEKNGDYDEGDFLEEAYPYMTDINRHFDIAWPHYIDLNDGSNGEADVNMIADEFSQAIGRPVNASKNYHGGRREPGKYVVEPDGSLDADNVNDAGLEFVSPPLPIDELLSDLNKVKQWAGQQGCYTNKSTGLHINVSVPDFDNQKLDYVKLALLLGDKYILDQFGRTTNIYTKSAFDKVQAMVKQNPEKAQALLDKMRGHMDGFASKAIHSGSTDKYTSINTKSGYIEFRSPGGDWLDANFDKIETTLLRFTVALSAAMDPEAYREEYLKKLYKLLEPTATDKQPDTIKYFADYVAGKMPKAALRSFVKQAQLQRQVAKGNAPLGKKYWWNVQWDANRRIEVVAGNKEVAKQVAAEEWGVPESQLAGATVTMLRPYEEPAVRATAGEPQRVGLQTTRPNIGTQTDMENRLGWGSQSDDANYEIVDRNTNRPVFLFIANTDTEAWRKYSDWLAAAGYPEDTEDYGWRPRGARGQHAQSHLRFQDEPQPTQAPRTLTTPGQPQQAFTGNWLILDPNGREIHRFSGVGNVQSDANRVAMDWMRRRPGTMQAGVTVVPEIR